MHAFDTRQTDGQTDTFLSSAEKLLCIHRLLAAEGMLFPSCPSVLPSVCVCVRVCVVIV